MQAGEEPELECRVTVYNINDGYNSGLLEQCESLRGYMGFVNRVRERRASGVKLETAVKEAVDECIAGNILPEFFREHREEIVEMGIFEFDQELHDEILRSDAREEGKEEGKKIHMIEQVCRKLAKGKTVGTIADELEEEAKEIEKICEAASAFAPEYDAEMIYDELERRS